MMYNSEKMLRARQIAHQHKEDEEKEKIDKAKEKEYALYKKAEEAYLNFHEEGHLLDRLGTRDLQDIVRYLCYLKERGKWDTHLSHNRSKKR